MKAPLLPLVALLLFACGESGKIETTDAKSNQIATLFENVSAEKIDYLESLFSDDMKMVNSKEMEFDKTSFIAGIKDMYDLFDDIQFDAADGDADGSEIETNYYANGKVWTSIWNNFSATGKYTGQKVNIPFHISYQWKGDQIIEEYQFFDMTAFENEAIARNGINNTSEKITFLFEMSVNPSKSKAEIKALMEQVVPYMRENEPGAYDYGYYISDDGKKMTLIEKYINSEAALLHINNFEKGPNKDPFFEMFSFDSFVLTGNARPELRKRVEGYGVKFRTLVGGWTN